VLANVSKSISVKKQLLKTYAKQVSYSVRQAVGKGVRQGSGKGVSICCGRIVSERVGKGGSKGPSENVRNVVGTRAGEPVCKPLPREKSHSSQGSLQLLASLFEACLRRQQTETFGNTLTARSANLLRHPS
jgi:hypothetical protein